MLCAQLQETVASGAYLPYVDEPDHANVFAAGLWDLALVQVSQSTRASLDELF